MTTTSPVELVVDRLTGYGCNPIPHGERWEARCPAHADTTPSLSLAAGDDGRALLHCHAGCELLDVLAALQLDRSDLFASTATASANGTHDRRIVATYPYTDATGNLLYEVVRLDPKAFRQRRPDGNGGWLWKLGDTQRVLYRLPAVLDAAAAGHLVWLCEGEKDAEALQAVLPAGEVATTAPGGAGKWRPAYTSTLEGAGVMVWADADATGRAHALEVADALRDVATTVRLVESPRFKDAAEHLGAGLTLDDLIEVDLDSHDQGDEVVDVVSSWAPVDLGPIIEAIRNGTLERPVPEVGRIDGQAAGLLVRGKVNGFHGASTTGKTMTAEVIAAQELDAGHTVWFIDFEDSPEAVIMRFHELGTDLDTCAARLIYRRPAEVLGLETSDELQAALHADQPTLVIVDSTGEWMGLHGIEDKDVHVARFMASCARPLAATGAAVLLIDHVPHAEKDRLAPIGSVRKVNAVDGCQYLVTTVAEMARGRIGKNRFTVAKDRTGTRAKGTIAAETLIDSTGDFITASLLPPTLDDAPDTGPLAGLPPAARRVHAVLNDGTGLTTTAIGDLVATDGTTGTGLKARTIQDALKRLEQAGLAARTGVPGLLDQWMRSEAENAL